MPLETWDTLSDTLQKSWWDARYRHPGKVQCRPRLREQALTQLENQILQEQTHTALATALVISQWIPLLRAGGWNWVGIPDMVLALHALNYPLVNLHRLRCQAQQLPNHTHLRFSYHGNAVDHIAFCGLTLPFVELG